MTIAAPWHRRLAPLPPASRLLILGARSDKNG
jgi:hypothetical protein